MKSFKDLASGFSILLLVLAGTSCSTAKKRTTPELGKMEGKKVALVDIDGEDSSRSVVEVALINQLLKRGTFILINKKEVDAAKALPEMSPLDWKGIFEYVGFPAYMKPFAGGGWKNVYKLNDMEEFFERHAETGQLVMLLQEEIIFEEYYRCYCIGGKHVRIMPYEPRNPHHLRYVATHRPSKELLKTMEEIVLRINNYLGYDFNTVELAVRDGIPYAIDFCNPAPDADLKSVGEENFEWVVETAANYAIELAQQHAEKRDNLVWGEFVKRSANQQPLNNPSKK